METLETSTNECSACQHDVDVSGLEVGTIVVCPYCNHQFTVYNLFNHYKLTEKLGEGGMGAVYKATDLNLNRTVAIKVLKSSLSNNKKFIETFLREVEITASLRHPNIVQVYAFGQHAGHYHLVMEYIGKQTLDDDICEKKRLSEREALDIGIGVASGLNFALREGNLIHRDIKPGNILLTTDRTAKVVDFGLAMTPETADEIDGEIWGTPYYISPERLESIKEDFRSDMYSLGVTVYHTLAGKPPFDGDTAELVASMHLNNTPLPLATYAPHVSEQTIYAIRKSMSRHREDRFGSYEEFIAQLEDAKRKITQSQTAGNIHPTVVTEDSSIDRQAILIITILIGLVFLGVGCFLFLKFFQAF